MRLERGFRRIVITLSVLLFGLGIAFDVVTVNPRATVQVTLKDGRIFMVERHGIVREYLADRKSLAYALKDGHGVYKGGLKNSSTPMLTPVDEKGRPSGPPIPSPPDWVSPDDAFSIMSVEYVRGPEYWWWTDSYMTKVAAALVAFLWIVFYAMRWIVRGFARP